jgi:hypothetical protein
MEPMDEPYEHARCFETHDGDVCYEPEPTAEQMRRFADNEAHIAACNVLRLIVHDGPATAHALRGATLHSEATVARALVDLRDGGFIHRVGGRWRRAPEA